jgi:glutaredoxin-like protein NrdH
MADILDDLEYSTEDGPVQDREVLVFALSTCAFCKRALDFLKTQNVRHSYVYLDRIDPDLKKRIKADLKERYTNLPVFPVLVIDRQQALSGFTEARWREGLGLPPGDTA